MHHALYQLQQLQIGIQPGRRGAGLQLQNLAEPDRRRVDRGHLQRAERGDHFGGRAVELRHCRSGLNQLRDRGLSVEQLGVVAGRDIEIDRQLIKVFEQVDISLQQSIPAQSGEVDVATEQSRKQRVENIRLSGIDARQITANVQLGDGRLRFCGDGGSIQGGVLADRCPREQRAYATGETGGHRATGRDLDRCRLSRISGERAHPVGAGQQSATTGCQGIGGIDGVSITHGALPGISGCRQARQAIATATDRLQGGVIHHALQFALLHVQAAGIDHQQHHQHRNAEGHCRRQTDRPALSGRAVEL